MNKDERMRKKIQGILIECRIEKGITQTELGKAVGKSKNAVASWEQGLSLPDAVMLYKLARFYDKSIDYMYGESEE